MKKQIISWSEQQALTLTICRQIANSGWKPNYVVGITRGGLLPATMISHWLDVPMQSLDVCLREHQQTVSNCGMAEDAFDNKNILVVDDINDSGATFNWIMNDWENINLPDNIRWKDVWNKNVKFAVVVDNLASDCDVSMDFVGMEIDKFEENVWIDFPYENFWETK